MTKIERVLWLLVLLFMVAEEVSAGDPVSTKEFNVGRAFAHCTKLTKDNYDLWLTGLISTMVGITGMKAMKTVLAFFEYFEQHGGKGEKEIEDGLKALIAASVAYDEVVTLMYIIIQTTIDAEKEPQLAKTATMMKYRGKGIAFMKYIFDRIGPGSISRQTAKKLRLQEEKQQDSETGEQFCDRLIHENSSLTTPIDGTMMCSIFIKGLSDMELKKYLLGEQLKNNITDLDLLKDKCDEYEVQSEILHSGVDGFYAGVRGGRAGRGRGRSGRGDNGGRGGRGNCLFCNMPYHYWRACRLLNRARRHPNTTAEQHAAMDRKRDELLAKCSAELRQQINEYLSEQNDNSVSAQMAQPQREAQLEFPNVDGHIADVVVRESVVGPCGNEEDSLKCTSNKSNYVIKLWKMFLALLALFLSSSGIILMLALFFQFGGTSAQSVAVSECGSEEKTDGTNIEVITIPSYAHLKQHSGQVSKDACYSPSQVEHSSLGFFVEHSPTVPRQSPHHRTCPSSLATVDANAAFATFHDASVHATHWMACPPLCSRRSVRCMVCAMVDQRMRRCFGTWQAVRSKPRLWRRPAGF